MRKFKRRTYLELCVGSSFSLDAYIHLDHHTLNLFNENATSAFEELLHLLQTSIVPKLFSNEIEAAVSDTDIPPLGEGGVPIIQAGTTGKANPSTKGRKRKRKTKKQIAEEKRRQEAAARESRSLSRDFYYSSGQLLDLAYRPETSSSTEDSASLVLLPQSKTGHGISAAHLQKLPKQLSIWCFKKGHLDEKAEETFRPEMIPLSSLFRAGT